MLLAWMMEQLIRQLFWINVPMLSVLYSYDCLSFELSVVAETEMSVRQVLVELMWLLVMIVMMMIAFLRCLSLMCCLPIELSQWMRWVVC